MLAALPRHIGHIVGYSPTKQRMYFKGKRGNVILSSADGIALDITEAVVPEDLVAAVPVPGKARGELGEMPWIGARTEYKGKRTRTLGYHLNINETFFSHFRGNIQRFHQTHFVVFMLSLRMLLRNILDNNSDSY